MQKRLVADMLWKQRCGERLHELCLAITKHMVASRPLSGALFGVQGMEKKGFGTHLKTNALLLLMRGLLLVLRSRAKIEDVNLHCPGGVILSVGPLHVWSQ